MIILKASQKVTGKVPVSTQIKDEVLIQKLYLKQH